MRRPDRAGSAGARPGCAARRPEALALDFAALVTSEETPAGERQPSPSLKAVAPAAPDGRAAVRAKGNGAPRKAIPVA